MDRRRSRRGYQRDPEVSRKGKKTHRGKKKAKKRERSRLREKISEKKQFVIRKDPTTSKVIEEENKRLNKVFEDNGGDFIGSDERILDLETKRRIRKNKLKKLSEKEEIFKNNEQNSLNLQQPPLPGPSTPNEIDTELQGGLSFQELVIRSPPKQKKKYDMFADSSNSSPNSQSNSEEGRKAFTRRGFNFDDDEFYYKIKEGEILLGKFRVEEEIGKGVYGSVVRASELSTNRMVAIKILRNAEIITRAGEREIVVMELLNSKDYFDKMHILRFLGSFEHMKHLCIVTELLSLNMRTAIQMYGKRVGISIGAVRSYSYQLFMALHHLKKNYIVHADIKPDNLMLSENRKKCKLIDFGNAMKEEDLPRSPELVARFYRAPEIILGLPVGFGIDMWSAACSVFEMYTGTLLFKGVHDNAMLKQMMILKGPINSRMLKKGLFSSDHFDLSTNRFMSLEKDKVTLKEYVKYVNMGAIHRVSIAERLEISDTQTNKVLQQFRDLMERCLHLDPEKRLTPETALRHKFFHSGKSKRKQKKKSEGKA